MFSYMFSMHETENNNRKITLNLLKEWKMALSTICYLLNNYFIIFTKTF